MLFFSRIGKHTLGINGYGPGYLDVYDLGQAGFKSVN